MLLGKYRVDRVLGEGGMGKVVQATHVQLGHAVAIKYLRPAMLASKDVVKRFQREAQASVRLKGEHVCKVHDVGAMDDGAPYIVMEFMRGQDLNGLVQESGRLPPGTAVHLLLQACAGLAEAHALGIIHRDIKPANLFLTTRPDGSTLLKVLDFGISKLAPADDEGLTSTQATLGTAAYMSPEQMRSSKYVDARTDIWALGVVLFEMLSGHRPFRGDGFASTCLNVAMEPTPPLNVPIPPGLEALVARCLEKDCTLRFQSVAELALALAPYAPPQSDANRLVDSVCGTLATGADGRRQPTAPRLATNRPVSTLSSGSGQMRREAQRRPAGWLVGIGVTALAAALVAVMAIGSDGADPDSPTDVELTGAGAPAVLAPSDSGPDAAVADPSTTVPAATDVSNTAPAAATGAASDPEGDDATAERSTNKKPRSRRKKKPRARNRSASQKTLSEPEQKKTKKPAQQDSAPSTTDTDRFWGRH